ncbi:RNA demethylase ALKBH9B-like [Nicotiana tabacum]|uniref:RNA demethylase ALKBH9B-like n=1 Tax=Nicotiana tabacum TaxID=4097 RepID=UPI003F4E70D0
MSDHRRSRKIDPFLLSYTADELLIASEFLSNWFPFLSHGLCQSCTLTLSCCIRSLDLEAAGDAERLKQQEAFTVLTPELPDSNYCSRNLDNCVNIKECADLYDTADTNSLGSWKDGVDRAERLKQQENFTVLTPELPDSNDCNGNLHNCVNNSLGSRKECADSYDTADTNSLGSWKDGTNGAEHLKQQENFTVFTPELPDSNDCNGELDNCDKNSLGSWKECADFYDTADTNSLGSWKDGTDGPERFDEASVRRNNRSDSYVGGADRLSRPVEEASRSKTFSSLIPAASPRMKMSWADMAEEDELDAEDFSESTSWSSQLGNGNGVNEQESSIQETKRKTELSREQIEHIRFCNVKRRKDFICLERVNGKYVNILDGLELHTGVFSMAEQNRIVKFVEKLEEMGKNGQLKERTYTAPRKWMRGKGRVTIQFGCCYNYAKDKKGNPPGILKTETVDPLPNLLKVMIRRLVRWHVMPPNCVPDSCIVNIYEEGDCIPPHIDNHEFVRPFCTVSLLSECNIVFGSNLKTVAPGEFAGAIALPLPVGSVLVLKGNGADVAKHCVPAVPTKRISITFRRMDESKRPMGYVPEQDLQGLQPLSYEADRYEDSNTSKSRHSTRKQSGRQEENKETVKISIERNFKPHYFGRNRQGPADTRRVWVAVNK